MLHGVWRSLERAVDDALQRDVLSLAERDIRREHELRSARPDAVAQGAFAEPRENDHVDRPDSDGREHEQDRFRNRGHVDRNPIAFPDAHAAQGGGHAHDLVPELAVGIDASSPPFVDRHEGGVPPAAGLDVVIQCVVSEVRLTPFEPAEEREVPGEGAIPGPKPGQLPRGA